jgi:hypothetical protein
MLKTQLGKTFYIIPLFFFGSLLGFLIRDTPINLRNIVFIFIFSYCIWLICGLLALAIDNVLIYFIKK